MFGIGHQCLDSADLSTIMQVCESMHLTGLLFVGFPSQPHAPYSFTVHPPNRPLPPLCPPTRPIAKFSSLGVLDPDLPDGRRGGFGVAF